MGEVFVDSTKISDRGQVVIPKEIRERLGLREGSRLLVFADDDAIVLQRADVVSERLRARELIGRARALVERLVLKR